MSTPNRIETNQANAQHSTGPKTDVGKKRSSLNALRHGLTSQIVVMPSEDLYLYQLHLKSFTDEYNPKGATEAHLVQALADASWRLNRIAALETNLLAFGIGRVLGDATTGSSVGELAVATAAALQSQSKALATLSIHSQRLSHQFERTVAQLRDLQESRRISENHEVDQLIDIVDMHQATGTTYDPFADGFVFSEQEINQRIRARRRSRLAHEAYQHRRNSAA
jgi:hypothetical protein